MDIVNMVMTINQLDDVLFENGYRSIFDTYDDGDLAAFYPYIEVYSVDCTKKLFILYRTLSEHCFIGEETIFIRNVYELNN